MPALNISKSITIDRPTLEVFEIVRNFTSWPYWSPWIIIEPDCKLSYSEDGKSYSWDGNIIGSGTMDLDQAVTGKSLEMDLQFFKPWKSQAKVIFLFDTIGNETKVTWSMNGSLPFFMFWMKSMMACLVGMDYERGLLMLKDFAERGSVPCKLDFEADQKFKGFDYVGIRTKCAIAEIGPRMKVDLLAAADCLNRCGISPSGNPFSIYNKWDPIRGIVDYTTGIPVDASSDTQRTNMMRSHLASCKAYRVRHTGPYRHLGNAWSAGMMHGRAKVFSQNRRALPFEIYENDPQDTPEDALVTSVYLPSK